MSLTDERIREMFDAWFDPDDNGNYWDCWWDACRAVEAEATKPQPYLKCAEGMVSVTKEDANNYCRILTLLGMEEEGSPIEGVERLISLRDGMTCGDCNDTGWLENREEGRYPCTCMTEAEPYQILEAERDALAMQNQQMREALEAVDAVAEISDGIVGWHLNGNIAGWSEILPEVNDVLFLPDNTEAIIKRHDAAVLRGAAEVCESRQTPGTGSVAILSGAADELRRMAAKLEKS